MQGSILLENISFLSNCDIKTITWEKHHRCTYIGNNALIFMVVFGRNQQGPEPTTYPMRGGHTKHFNSHPDVAYISC